MEVFKQAIKEALQNQSIILKIEESSFIHQVSPKDKEIALPSLPRSDREWIENLMEFLFEDQKELVSEGVVVQGVLKIPNVGQLKAIAFSQNHKLHINLYFPGIGHQRFDSDWENINRPSPSNSAYALNSDDMEKHNTSEDQDDQFVEQTNLFSQQQPYAEPDEPDQDHNFDSGLGSGIEHAIGSDMDDSAEYRAEETFVVDQYSVKNPAVVPTTEYAHGKTYEPTPSNRVFQTPPMETQDTPPQIIFGNDDPSTTIIRNGDFPIDSYLRTMVKAGASDIHLTLDQPIIFRIDGDLVRQQGNILDASTMENLFLPIMPIANKREFAKSYDTDFAYELPGTGRFRVNMFKDNYGVGAVLRQIPATVLTADQLDLPPAIRSFCHLHKGLVLVTGPTGSGKSTTLAAMIDLINKTRPDHILTIEDPIEFVHQQQKCLVNQREVGKHTDSFKRALKAALREDPDIVLIGELRDLETIHIALETAETGHLVFGTLHTNTAVSTIDRIIDQFSSEQQSQIRTMLASSLKGVVAQTLLKKKGGGRVAAHEILVTNDAVGNMIRESKNHMVENHMQTQKKDGNMLLNESLIKLVKQGLVEPKVAYSKSIDKAAFLENAKRAGVNTNFVIGENPLQGAS